MWTPFPRRARTDRELLALSLAFMDEISYKAIAFDIPHLSETGYRWLSERYGLDRESADERAMQRAYRLN